MLHAYLLHQLTLLVVQLVHVAVYLVKADILMEVRLQIVCRGRLAQWLADAGDDQMAKHLIPYPVKTYAVVNLVQYLLRAVKDNGRDVVQYTLRLKELLLYYATLDKINLLLSTIPAYPLGSLGIQTAGFLLGLGYTEALYFLEASPALVDHHDTDGACPVFLLAWEHAAKVSKNPESPKSPSKNPCL